MARQDESLSPTRADPGGRTALNSRGFRESPSAGQAGRGQRLALPKPGRAAGGGDGTNAFRPRRPGTPCPSPDLIIKMWVRGTDLPPTQREVIASDDRTDRSPEVCRPAPGDRRE